MAKFNARTAKRRLDKLWSLIVRARDNHICQWGITCGGKQDFRPGALQAAHIHGKKANPAVRHSLCNGVTLCVGCHFMADRNKRIQFTEWLRKRMGEDDWDSLLLEANATVPTFNVVVFEKRLAYLKDQAKKYKVAT
jgi:hypothetical protein